jgi:hypothetical protein
MKALLMVKSNFIKFERTLYATALGIIKIIDSKLGGEERITNSRAKAEEALKALNDALNRSRKSEYTELVAKADKDRDSLYRALVLRIESDSYITYDAKIQANAIKLDGILIENGKAMERSGADQTNQLESLFTRFDEQIEIIKENGIDVLYEHVKLSNDNYLKTATEGTEVSANSKEIPWLRDAADELINTVNGKLLKRIEMEADEQGEPFVTVLNMLNNHIEKVHKIQKARIARNETEDDPDVVNEEEKESSDAKVKEPENETTTA